jgi:hypothetical protein
MATVVYTAIDSLANLSDATWQVGAQNSYAATAALADHLHGRIRLIGRMPERGSVQIVQCGREGREWVICSGRHITLAQFFLAKLSAAPAGDILRPFFDEIDDAQAREAAGRLIALECGAGAKYQPFGAVHDAILDICGVLSRLGVPTGDWVFDPLLAAYRETA